MSNDEIDALYKPVWDLHDKAQWPDRVKENLISVVGGQEELIKRCREKYGDNSVQYMSMCVCSLLLEPMTNIFISQLKHAKSTELSWIDIDPESSGQLYNVLNSQKFKDNINQLSEKASEYDEIFEMLPQWMEARDQAKINKLTSRSVSLALSLHKKDLPVVLMTSQSAFTKLFEPDVRLIFPTSDVGFRKAELEMQADIFRLVCGKKFRGMPGIVGTLEYAIGSQWASLTTGEGLHKTYVLCHNMYKTFGTIEEVYFRAERKFDKETVINILNLLYGGHEYSHTLDLDGAPTKTEFKADLPSVLSMVKNREKFKKWNKNIEFEDIVLCMAGDFLDALKWGIYDDEVWDAYYFSAVTIWDGFLKSGLVGGTTKGSVKVNPECGEEFITLMSKKMRSWEVLKEPTDEMKNSNLLSHYMRK